MVDVAEVASRTMLFNFDKIYDFTPPPGARKYATEVCVIEQDCIEAALHLRLDRGLNPLVLNMASAKRPGGGWREGAGAQEENLFRRTNYVQVLEDPDELVPISERNWFYPIPEFSGIYNPEVMVFRESEAAGYGFMPCPIPLSFVAVAAYTGPKLVSHKIGNTIEIRLAPKFAENTLRKIKTLFQIALQNGHDSIVLSAMGCGAYRNPPAHIAHLFHEVITKTFTDCFKNITIAIIEDHNSRKEHNPEGNFKPFADVFRDFKQPNVKKIIICINNA